jgi:hypothetical protein
VARDKHPKRPYGWFRLVHEEYLDVYRWFPDASEQLVCNMLGIDADELRNAILHYRRYRRVHRWEIKARQASEAHRERQRRARQELAA